MMFLLLFLLMSIYLTPAVCGSELSVPSDVAVKVDAVSQTLMVFWFSNCTLFHIQIYYTDLNQLLYNERVSVGADPQTGSHSWSWYSEVPLQCTSHSVRIRAQKQNSVSQWSPLVTIRGQDVPAVPQPYMYPQDKVLLVGSNVTVCCIEPVGHSVGFHSIRYMDQVLESRRLSRRTYTTTITNLQPSGSSGTNIICNSNASILTGTVIFIGYPPGDEELQCETRDLKTADCQWRKGRDTNLRRLIYLTTYTLNTRNCKNRRRETCHLDNWADTFTLEARNPLGMVQLNDSAPIMHRVRLLAPVNMTLAVKAWQAAVGWNWTVEAYRTLEMVCQVELSSRGHTDTRNYTGVGLSSVTLNRLKPDTEYTFLIRCATLRLFWRWGDWSAPYSLLTKMDRPEAVDVWVWRSSEYTAHVVWKLLSLSESHGTLQAYEVCFKTVRGKDMGLNVSVPITVSNVLLQLNQIKEDVIVSMAAHNLVGVSQLSTIRVTPFISDSEVPVSELVGGRGGISVSWTGVDSSSTGYVIEWRPTCSSAPSSVQWEKVSSSNTSFLIQSDTLRAGVRYTISVFSLRSQAIVLVQTHHAYIQELGPSAAVDGLSAHQLGSDVVLSWNPVNICDQSSFIRGYSIYTTHGSNISLIVKVPDPTLTQYRVKGLVLGTYKFMVSWFSSTGESSSSTITIITESENLIMVEIFVALGIMSLCLFIIIIFCYKKREWVKKAFYPEIPGPKLTGDWTVPTAPLDVKPSPHSLVHIVESPDKDGLVTELEEPDGGRGDSREEKEVEMEVESDEQALLRYYNQLVNDTSGFSSSSADSVDTQVTYTDIESPGYRPQTQAPALLQEQEENPEAGGGEGGGGYKPQCTWRSTSPEHESLSGSLGSPTSITSSQFLLPETEEHPQAPGTWFHNLISGKF